jgi:putative polymerase
VSHAGTEHHPLGRVQTKAITVDIYKLQCFLIVSAALSFNFFLCFINTNVATVSTFHVIVAELFIISVTFLVCFRMIGAQQFIVILMIFLYLLFLAIARAILAMDGKVDLKIIRDFMIPVAFFLLGTGVRDMRTADATVFGLAIVVVGAAIFEYFFVGAYLHYFNIIKYYLARGTIEAHRLSLFSTNLFESGIRPEGRAILPILGDHRVSSIFLEPVSPGNFAVMVFFWAMVRFRTRKVFSAALILIAILLIIMADNRFGAYLCGLAIVISLLPNRFALVSVASLPIAALSLVLWCAYMFEQLVIDNSLLGRLVWSGRVLHGFDTPGLLGLEQSASLAFDSGYAYIIGQVGIMGFIGFWLLFMMLKGANSAFQLFRLLTGLYLATILCVSNSPFTIKTAALLWFLLGALAGVPEEHVHTTRASHGKNGSWK